jgi:hypothetical protein
MDTADDGRERYGFDAMFACQCEAVSITGRQQIPYGQKIGSY